MKRTIAIEAQRIFRQHKGGMDVVILEIIRELQELDKVNQYYILVAPGPDRCLEETGNFRIIELPGSFYPLWEQFTLIRALRSIRPDLLHCTSNTAPILWRGRMLLTLHDIIFLEKSAGKGASRYQWMGRIYRRWLIPLLLRRDFPLITVSQAEKTRISDRLGIKTDRIHVVYNACSAHFFPRECTPEERAARGMPPDYFLVLGNTDPRKNVSGVLQAYTLYLKSSKHPRPLVITGLTAQTLETFLPPQDREALRPHILLPGYVPWRDLPWWYSGAIASLYMSFREGFGIPILESMACGTPVLTSAVSSMPEVAGPGGLLADPSQPEDIAGWMLRLEEQPELRTFQQDYGLRRAQEFSWNRSAQEILKMYLRED